MARGRNRRRGGGGRRRGRGGGGFQNRGGGGRKPEVVDVVVISPPAAARGPSRKSNGGTSMARGRRGGGRGGRSFFGRTTKGGQTYAAVAGDVGVQVGCEAAEFTAALVKGYMDMYATNSESTADDTAFPVLQKGIGSGMRALGDFLVAKKHPALAKVMSAFGSSMSGTVYLGWVQQNGVKATKRAAERLQGGSTP